MKLNIRSKPWRCRRRTAAAAAGTTAGQARPCGRAGSALAAGACARACAVPVFISFVQGGVSRYQETYTL